MGLPSGVIALLEQNNRSAAFDGWAVGWEEEATAVTALCTLTPAVPPTGAPGAKGNGGADCVHQLHLSLLRWLRC